MPELQPVYSESTPLGANRETTRLVQDTKRLNCCPAPNHNGYSCTDCSQDNNRSVNNTGRANTPVQIEDMESVDVDEDEQKGFKFSQVSTRKKVVLCLCTFANFLSACAYALIGPFFPTEALHKGLNLTMIGFIFGVYQLVVFVTSPFIGNVMIRAGVKFMFLSGIFIGGCSAILFGVLGKGPGGTSFLVMCILVRSVEAFGFAAFMASSMTIASSEFKEHAGSVLALLKAASGCGHLVGPILAGVLYDIGGFGLPFYCTAIPTLLNGLFIYRFLPPLLSEVPHVERKRTILYLLRSPLVVIPMCSVFVAMLCIQFFLSAFATYLEPFGVSSSVVGLMLTIGPVFFISTSPLWGYIVDVKDKQAVLLVGAHLSNFIGWWVLGHSPFLPFIPFKLWTIGIGFAIIGITLGCLYIAPIKCMLYGAYELGYEKGPDTFAIVSGLFNSAYALGGFLGPLVGGILAQRYGHSWVFTATGLMNLFMFFLTFGFFFYRYYIKQKRGRGM